MRPADSLFPDRRVALAEGRCTKPPMGCGKPVNKEQMDSLTEKEYNISALCTSCQITIFGYDDYGGDTLDPEDQ